MSFERHHPNRDIERNLARARDLRSAWLLAGLVSLGEHVARAWRERREGSAASLDAAARTLGKHPI
jgi:hypothetical protein